MTDNDNFIIPIKISTDPQITLTPEPKSLWVFLHHGITIYQDGRLIHHQDYMQYGPNEWDLLCKILNIEFNYSQISWMSWPWYESESLRKSVHSSNKVPGWDYTNGPPKLLKTVHQHFAILKVKCLAILLKRYAEEGELHRKEYDEAVKHARTFGEIPE